MLRATALAAALLSTLALVPAASADPVECSFALWFWHADYGCRVLDAGADGTVVWCPIAEACADDLLLACWIDTTPPWFCAR